MTIWWKVLLTLKKKVSHFCDQQQNPVSVSVTLWLLGFQPQTNTSHFSAVSPICLKACTTGRRSQSCQACAFDSIHKRLGFHCRAVRWPAVTLQTVTPQRSCSACSTDTHMLRTQGTCQPHKSKGSKAGQHSQMTSNAPQCHCFHCLHSGCIVCFSQVHYKLSIS